MKIAIAGSTGVVGRHVVNAARSGGLEVVELSRSTGCDLTNPASLRGLIDGARSVIDVSNTSRFTRRAATAFFASATASLTSEAERAGVQHFISLSIVGIDRASSYGYYNAKMLQESLVVASPVPSSIVRATQFHEFASQLLERVRVGPVAFVPHMKVQSVDAKSLAEFLFQVAMGDPLSTVTEVAGPEVGDIVQHARRISERRHGPRVVALPVVGSFARSISSGVLLPSRDATILGPTFESWLNDHHQ
jgi:uncharacterized protein YbjT (DUF2867 family)